MPPNWRRSPHRVYLYYSVKWETSLRSSVQSVWEPKQWLLLSKLRLKSAWANKPADAPQVLQAETTSEYDPGAPTFGQLVRSLIRGPPCFWAVCLSICRSTVHPCESCQFQRDSVWHFVCASWHQFTDPLLGVRCEEESKTFDFEEGGLKVVCNWRGYRRESRPSAGIFVADLGLDRVWKPIRVQ